jgi:hypothetical protein
VPDAGQPPAADRTSGARRLLSLRRIRGGRVSVRRLLIALVAVIVLVVAAVNLIGQTVPQPHGRAVSSIFEDDTLLVPPAATPAADQSVENTVQKLKAIGADRLRIIVEWQYIEPATSRPANFDAADPADYNACSWYPYDRIVRDAKAAGLGIDFDITGPAPTWLTAGQPAGVEKGVYEPEAAAFEKFVHAIGKRYGGKYSPGAFCPNAGMSDKGTLPRVEFWSVWNEPNQPGWLAPQYTAGPNGTYTPTAPRLYRQLVDAYWTGLKQTGHTPSTDTLLVGELAPDGCIVANGCPGYGGAQTEWPMPPITFLQDMYCVGTDYKQLTGAAATAVGCPASGSTSAFVAANPALFQMSGFADHPYSFQAAPDVSVPESAFVPLANIQRLENALDAIYTTYGVGTQVPLYLTEYGSVTNLPNPKYNVGLADQSKFLNQAMYMVYNNKRIKALGQFELQDSPPNTQYPSTSPKYWETFQEGLEFLGGKPKPSLASYQLPIWIPPAGGDPDGIAKTASGGSVTVWGMLRAAPNETAQTAQIQWRPPSGNYRTIATVITRDTSGFLDKRVTPPGSGAIRISWQDPNGQTLTSRAVGVEVSGP